MQILCPWTRSLDFTCELDESFRPENEQNKEEKKSKNVKQLSTGVCERANRSIENAVEATDVFFDADIRRWIFTVYLKECKKTRAYA